MGIEFPDFDDPRAENESHLLHRLLPLPQNERFKVLDSVFQYFPYGVVQPAIHYGSIEYFTYPPDRLRIYHIPTIPTQYPLRIIIPDTTTMMGQLYVHRETHVTQDAADISLTHLTPSQRRSQTIHLPLRTDTPMRVHSTYSISEFVATSFTLPPTVLVSEHAAVFTPTHTIAPPESEVKHILECGWFFGCYGLRNGIHNNYWIQVGSVSE